ncbi:hypothetical protein [Alkalibacillus aidingensis]|uniref:hypothetical protein n=1 Tax=Alkalibacillus aidingensis TaxID=2747607 RepID=UPI001660F05D|nr:hypothetical protein [Alkalibacillus aidingensis]
MEKLILGLSSFLFLVTWIVVIVLYVDMNQPTFTAKTSYISEEIMLLNKESFNIDRLVSQSADEHPDNEDESDYSSESVHSAQAINQMREIDDSSLDLWRDYFKDGNDGISIDELYEIFEIIDKEAISGS